MGKKQYTVGLWDMKSMFRSLLMFFFGVLTTVSFYRNKRSSFGLESLSNIRVIKPDTPVFDHPRRLKKPPPPLTDSCDLFSGRWVYDNKSHYPLYKDSECPFMNGDLACQTWGRKDDKYQKWRWQPHGCDLPRFDAKAVLERLRDKRLMFVGDSVNRNQWVSMVCMLQSSIANGLKTVSVKGDNKHIFNFKATEYNVSIDYYWAPMLVESNGDDPFNHRLSDRVIRSKSIEKHAKHWVDADILVFNSYLWWRLPTVKILKSGPFEGPDQVFQEVDNQHAYKMVLETWSKWLRTNVNPSKTKLFFMGITATHSRGRDWGGTKDETCYGQTEPVLEDGFWESGTNQTMVKILESSLNKLKAKGLNVQMINVTQLTQYRKDAHPTIYKRVWRPRTEEELKNPSRYADCTHWCLPGVPDVWNELLSAYILR